MRILPHENMHSVVPTYIQSQICIRQHKGGAETISGKLLFQQIQLLSVMPTLVLALAQSIFMLLAALGGRQTSLTALKFAHKLTVCGATQKMLE